MDCDCSVTTTAGVALVGVRLRNPTPVARRVRVENRLTGPVCPPRSEGVPTAGWDETGISVVVHPHETRPLGYACPLDTRDDADPESDLADPPAVVVTDERVPSDSASLSATGRTSPPEEIGETVDAVVRDLGRPAPPRDAVPAPDFEMVAESDTETDSDLFDATDDESSIGNGPRIDDGESPRIDDSDSPRTDDTLPPPVTAWLAEIERRVDTAERLDPDTSVSTATRAVEGIDAPPTALPTRLAADRRRLADLAERIDRLAARAESASVPADHLRRLS